MQAISTHRLCVCELLVTMHLVTFCYVDIVPKPTYKKTMKLCPLVLSGTACLKNFADRRLNVIFARSPDILLTLSSFTSVSVTIHFREVSGVLPSQQHLVANTIMRDGGRGRREKPLVLTLQSLMQSRALPMGS